MGWRTAAGQMAAGTYDAPGDQEGAGFAAGFASTFVPALSGAIDDYVTEKRDKRMLELKESLYRQRPRATSTAAADRKSQGQLLEIQAIADSLNISVNEAASLYYGNDGNAAKAVTAYNSSISHGLVVTPLVEPTPEPSAADPLTDQTSAIIPEAPAAQTADTAIPDVPMADATDNLEATQEVANDNPTGTVRFDEANAFKIASTGSIADAFSLISPAVKPEDAAATVAAEIENTVEAGVKDGTLTADASGAVPVVTYEKIVESGATPAETKAVLKAGTRLPDYYTIPEQSAITTLAEAQAAMDVLEARRGAIGQDDTYYAGMKPLLERRIASLTVLPDLGAMLQDNSRDKLQEFYESGWKAYEGKVDPAQLQAHRDRTLTLLQQPNSMPEIPKDMEGLRNMQDRVAAGEFTYLPLEWKEQLNVATRRAELATRYGDKLTVDYIMDESRSDRELIGLRAAVVGAMGETDPVVRDIDVALGTRKANPVLPEVAAVNKGNWVALAADARAKGSEALAVSIEAIGKDATAADATNGTNKADALDKLATVLRGVSQPITEVNSRADAYVGAVKSAYELNKIVQENPKINYFFGGAVPRIITSAVGEIEALRALVSGESNAPVDVTSALNTISDYERKIEQRFINNEINDAARAYAMYQAQEQRLAFQLARMQQGPAGVISNQDFQSALGQVRASKDPSNYEASLRGLITADETAVNTAITSLSSNPQILIAKELQAGLGKDYLQGALSSIPERVAAAGITEAYNWAKGGEATAPEAPAKVSIPAGAIEFLRNNPDQKAAFEAKYGVPASTYLEGN